MKANGDIAAELRRALRYLTASTIILYVALGALFSVGLYDSRTKRDEVRRDEARTSAALCTLRADISHRVQASKDFLLAHPKGIPGISQATLAASIASQAATVTALAGLPCDGGGG